MSRRRARKYIPRDIESSKGIGDTFSAIYKSMMLSEPWKKLTHRSRDLYYHLKAEMYGHSKHDKSTQNYINKINTINYINVDRQL